MSLAVDVTLSMRTKWDTLFGLKRTELCPDKLTNLIRHKIKETDIFYRSLFKYIEDSVSGSSFKRSNYDIPKNE